MFITSFFLQLNLVLSINSTYQCTASTLAPSQSINFTSPLPTCQISQGSDGYVPPIIVDGKHFVNSFTNERFYIKGVDYQPGGSAAYTRETDPLSNVDQCSRDIYLMQQLGINTVRIYTVNPKLDHDDCMTMLAAANIYLILDVNSPFFSESLNRYEPWTTYTPEYLRHVFEVIDQFSRYNNTLGFFIGNEVVNDERSAAVSPPYIRAVARDVKDYMYYNCPRMVPIGYSAADDLKYRTQLPHFLTCGDQETAVDFYGVNSYQWCGKQTMESSGYDVLVRDHSQFNFPVFFSEFGCNHIQPRIFQEVEALYSENMTKTFDGGLVYEFSQEVNDYGLVFIDESGDAYIRGEFETLKNQFAFASRNIVINQETAAVEQPISYTSPAKLRPNQPVTDCKPSYSYLSGANKPIPDSFGTEMIRNGVRTKRGRYNTEVLIDMPASKYSVYDVDGNQVKSPQVKVVNNFVNNAHEFGWVPRKGVSGFSDDVQGSAQNKQDVSKDSSKDKKKSNSANKYTAKGNLIAMLLTLIV